MLAPDGVDWALAVGNRNFIIHQYDAINRAITWNTLALDLVIWKDSLATLIREAEAAIEADPDSGVSAE